MYHNYTFNDITHALPTLLADLLREGEEHGSRNGTVKELTHVGTTLVNPWRREILVPGRRANIAAQIAETVWVLRGRNDMEFLSHYLPRARDYSDDGETWRGAYGPRLRKWTYGVDQIQHVVDLLRADPMSRQAVAMIYDPATDTEPGKDIPCNNWLTFTSRGGRLDLHVGIRSNDLMWGWSGINAFEWSVLQEVVAGMLGIEVGCLHFSTTSLHLYGTHWSKAEKIVTTAAETWSPAIVEDSPRFNALGVDDTAALDSLLDQWFDVEEGIRRGMDVQSLVDDFPEPMLRSWLRVLQWWWTGDHAYLKPLAGTRLEYATHVSLQPPSRETTPPETSDGSPFIRHAIATHNEKDAAYGDSWKRRGEMLGIMANIARKIDRLGGAETSDETSADTAMDLMVYLAKYRVWLVDESQSDDAGPANRVMLDLDREVCEKPVPARDGLESFLRQAFDSLEFAVNESREDRIPIVNVMLEGSYQLAHLLYSTSDVTRVVDDQYRGADAD